MFRIKYSREVALKLLFQIDLMGMEEKQTLPQLLEKNHDFFSGMNDREQQFALELVGKVQEQKEMIDSLISRNLKGWKLERLMTVDRSVLRLGIAESFINDQKAVIIDDMVRIAKKYGGEDSYKLINAILDKILE